MPWRFEDCWQRIEWANTHREFIGKTWNDTPQENLYESVFYVKDDGTGFIGIRAIYRPEVMDPVELHLGEFLYQLRAALDACIYRAAVIDSGVDPPPDHNYLEFPICARRRDFKQCGRKIAPLADERKAFIESIQPYNTPKLDPDHLTFNFNRSLAILNDWARKDRHRKLHVVGSWTSNTKPLLRLPPGVTLKYFRARTGRLFIEREQELATFQVIGYTKGGPRMQANANTFVDIGVDEIPPPCSDTDTLGNRMVAMCKAVEFVVAWMEKSFEIHKPLVKRKPAQLKGGFIIKLWQKLRNNLNRLHGLIFRS